MGAHYTHLLIPESRESRPTPEEVTRFFAGLGETDLLTGAGTIHVGGTLVTLRGLLAAVQRRKRDYDVRLTGALSAGVELVRSRSEEPVKKAKFKTPFGAAPLDVMALDDPTADPERDWIEAEAWSRPTPLQEHATIACRARAEPAAREPSTHPWTGAEIEAPHGGAVRFWIELRCFEKNEAPLFLRRLDLAHPSLVAAAEEAFACRFDQGCRWG